MTILFDGENVLHYLGQKEILRKKRCMDKVKVVLVTRKIILLIELQLGFWESIQKPAML